MPLEILQWLLNSNARCSLLKNRDMLCMKVAVDDPNGGPEHYTIFQLEDDFIQPLQALRESING